MSRFDAYLLEAEKSRGKAISEDTARELLQKHCKQSVKALRNGTRIYRGVNKTDSFIYIDPKTGIRRSIDKIPNYYTFILSNDKSWSAYPKRSRSLICSTYTATGYGTTYNVLFYDGAKIGIVPHSDIWYSWKNISDIVKFMMEVDNIFNLAHNTTGGTYDKSLKQFKDACKKVDEAVKNDERMLDELHKRLNSVNTQLRGNFVYKGSFYKMLVEIFDPKGNGFTVSTIKNVPSNKVEVWSDSEAILIKNGYPMKILDTIEV